MVAVAAIATRAEASWTEEQAQFLTADEIDQAAVRFSEDIPEDAFGGLYLDAAGNLVVNIKEGSAIPRITGLDTESGGQIRIETVKYALAELEAIKTA